MALLIQDFLRSYGADHQKAFGKLKTDYGIEPKQSVVYPELFLFKYDQIESPMGSPLVQECRGLILNSQKDWEIVAYPFNKFFNYGEGHAAEIDWSTARVQEKVDGSLMILYWYNDQWNVASSGNPDAAGEVNGFGFTFNELFWKTWLNQGFTIDGDRLNPHMTYMFELTTPYNKVVVPHKECKLTLLGVRVINQGDADWGDTLKEHPVRNWEDFFPVVKEFPLTSMDDVLKSFDHIDGMHQEGYVVVDANFNRVKVKHPQYVALHHLRDSLGGGPKSIVRILMANEGSEFLTYFPEFKDMYEDIKARFHKWIDGLDEQYDIIFDDCNGNRGRVNRKDFALQATKTRLPAYFFARLDGKVNTVREYVKDMNVEHVMKALKLKDIPMKEAA